MKIYCYLPRLVMWLYELAENNNINNNDNNNINNNNDNNNNNNKYGSSLSNHTFI